MEILKSADMKRIAQAGIPVFSKRNRAIGTMESLIACSFRLLGSFNH